MSLSSLPLCFLSFPFLHIVSCSVAVFCFYVCAVAFNAIDFLFVVVMLLVFHVIFVIGVANAIYSSSFLIFLLLLPPHVSFHYLVCLFYNSLSNVCINYLTH